jgi:TATA-box binding protein (TBP) (component of TFIID and TFIIIB)
MALEYDSIKVSTKTIIGVSNIQIDIQKIYLNFPIGVIENNVSIQTIYYGGERRGMIVDEKKKKKKSFRNAVNVIAMLGVNKKINFKVSKNGKFQLTGCKSEDQAVKIVSYFIEKLIHTCKNYVSITSGNSIKVYFQTVMTNIDFSIGFFINRQKLDNLMNKDTVYHSLLETSCGYTGVNIKFLLDMKWWDLEVPSISCDNVGEAEMKWDYRMMPLSEMTEIPMDKKQKKKYNTFLVFHSGNIIMSGMMRDTMKKDFDTFVHLLQKWKPEIEEKICEN